MRVLFASSSMDLVEASWVETLRNSGHIVDVVSLSHLDWLTRRQGISYVKPPKWLMSSFLQRSGNQIKGYFDEILELGKYEVIFAAGLVSGSIISNHVSIPVIPILWRQDLDYGSGRLIFANRFVNLTSAFPVLFLEDEFEFEKALAKGSKSVHLRHPRRHFHGEPVILNQDPRVANKIALVHPHPLDESRVRSLCELLEATLADVGVEVVPVLAASLYQARDMRRGRSVFDVLQEKLQEFSHVVITGAPRQGEFLAQYLVDTGQEDRLILEDTIGMASWADQIGFSARGRGQRLAEIVRERVLKRQPAVTLLKRVSDQPVDLIAEMITAIAGRNGSDFEALDVINSTGEFNVFFSSTTREDRTSGARPQRIRNMSDASIADSPTVLVSSIENNALRRVKLVRSLLAAGRKPGVFYGENSTTPIGSETVRREISELLNEWRQRGGRSAWFVRDLHWLDAKAEVTKSQDHAAMLLDNGLAELNRIGGAADLLLAPDAHSVEGFRKLLAGHPAPETSWSALPPGVAAMNIANRTRSTNVRAHPTVLYTGGIGAVYSMATFLETCEKLTSAGYFVDFLVRDGEQDLLNHQLEASGLLSLSRVSVSTTPLDMYVPKSELTIGTVLLDSEYAKFSFPYKTMSYIELGFPILTYSDMAIADFVLANNIGAVAERDQDSILATVLKMSSTNYQSGMVEARKNHSWANRFRDVKRMLAQQ